MSKHLNLRFITRVLLAPCLGVALLSGTTVAWAMPLHVETYGNDANDCSAAAPCRTIGAALAIVPTGGRVLVGPGLYEERVRVDTLNVSVLSRAGAAATIISADGQPGLPVVSITAFRVTFGGPDAGFTLRGDIDGTGIEADAERLDIVGNRVHGPVAYGIALSGRLHVVKDNYVSSSGAGRIGISMDASESDIEANRVSGFETCVRVRAGVANRNDILDNHLSDCATGINELNQGFVSFSDIARNRIVLSEAGVIGINTFRGNTSVDQNVVDLSKSDAIGLQAEFAKASFAGNTVLGGGASSASIGVRMRSGFSKVRVVDNWVAGVGVGLAIEDTLATRALRRNVWLATGCAVTLDAAIEGVIEFSNNFWETPGTPPDLSCSPAAAEALANGSFIMIPASSPD